MSQQQFINNLLNRNRQAVAGFDSKLLTTEFAEKVFRFLFGTSKRIRTATEVENEYRLLKSHLQSLLHDIIHNVKLVEETTAAFFETLPAIYDTLLEDAEATVAFDPAAESVEEVIIAYPGFYATVIYRIAHQLLQLKVPVVPRLLTEHAHGQTGIDIHPAARIGKAFAIDHGTGIVIGETTVIGNNVKLYQGVTLGALHSGSDDGTGKRHPSIEDNVIVYPGATILGGNTVVGRDSIVGGNAFLVYSVPPSSVVFHRSEVSVKEKEYFPEYLQPSQKIAIAV